MARRFFKRRKRKRFFRKFRKQFRRGRKVGKLSRTKFRGTGVPDCLFVKLRYQETFTPSVITAFDVNQWRGNSLFDPNFTGTGAQPNYFDNYAGIYAAYTVYGSKIRVRAISSSVTTGILLTVVPERVTSISAFSYDSQCGLPYAKSAICGTIEAQRITLKSYMATNKIYGLPKSSITANNEEFGALVGANPLAQWFWTVTAISDNQTSIIDYTISTMLTYYVRFWARTPLAQS